MSESETNRNDVDPGPETKPRPKPGPPPDDEAREELAKEPAYGDAIPGEYPEDDPDKEGEDRFDAG